MTDVQPSRATRCVTATAARFTKSRAKSQPLRLPLSLLLDGA